MRDETTSNFRVAGWCAFLSAIVAAVGIVFLLLLYVGFFTGSEGLLRFGPLNDFCIIVQYLLALPIVVAFHRILSPQSPRIAILASLIASVGIVGVVIFQYLLIAGAMTFEEQVGYASASLLVIGVWILITSTVARRDGLLNINLGVAVVGALYLGYPFWAYRVGQRLWSAERSSAR